jgi:hypothetical protein
MLGNKSRALLAVLSAPSFVNAVVGSHHSKPLEMQEKSAQLGGGEKEGSAQESDERQAGVD